jgi:Uma2 family endonuclease
MLSPMRKTVADYMAYDEERVELIDGEFLVTPAPSIPHQDIIQNLLEILAPQVKRLALGRIILSPADCILADDCVVQPDLMFVATGHFSRIMDQLHGPPDVAVEVLSPSHRKRDLDIKLKLYRKHVVPEYWIVDPKKGTVTVRVLESGDWRIHGTWKRSESAESQIMRGAVAPVDAVFGVRGL